MLLNGKLCKLIEQRDAVIKQIREIETERIKHDTLNLGRCKPLYDVLDKLNKEIAKEMMEGDM